MRVTVACQNIVHLEDNDYEPTCCEGEHYFDVTASREYQGESPHGGYVTMIDDCTWVESSCPCNGNTEEYADIAADNFSWEDQAAEDYDTRHWGEDHY